jgi:hypothetical protein
MRKERRREGEREKGRGEERGRGELGSRDGELAPIGRSA